MRVLRILFAASLLAILGTAASAQQWTVINLHPSGSVSSRAIGVGGGNQVGFAWVGDVQRASLWSGNAASWKDLHPAWASASEARSTDGVTQGGWATLDGLVRGIQWSGTGASAVDLTPYWAGATKSAAYSVRGGQKVGTVWFGDINYASSWNSGASTWVNLNPVGAATSRAYGTDGVQQVGNAAVDGVGRASLWFGSSDSWRDLHPAWAGATWSTAVAVGNGQQVGWSFFGTPGTDSKASLWNGTSASYINLHPTGVMGSSGAHGVAAGYQVGDVNMRAAMWSGTPASFVDLHGLLPRNTFQTSFATGISLDERYIYVVGWGYNMKTKRDEALMWRKRR